MHMESVRVTPAQFHGIEIKRWAKEIAELVLWIGYLQWHFRMHGKNLPVPEPVLRDYKNIECRDAVLAYDGEPELVRDKKGKPVTRWDGESMKVNAVTGEQVPDESAHVPVYKYKNPRKAEWPEADFIVGNPPFIGKNRIRITLGDAYVDALRQAHPDVSETADLVFYWWNEAAEHVATGRCARFGLITTNSITQTFNRRVIETANTRGVSLVFAIPDHPWVDTASGAAVRIAMTVGEATSRSGRLCLVTREWPIEDGVSGVEIEECVGRISPNLTVGALVCEAKPLTANLGISFQGIIPLGDGFKLTGDEARKFGKDMPPVIRRYTIGRDLVQVPEERYLIDFWGLSEIEAKTRHPALYQHVLVHVKPLRDQNRRSSRRDNWWLFAENAPKLRGSLSGLSRYIGTSETSKHRTFVFIPADVLADQKLRAVALDDAYYLGVLSSRIHVSWALAVGARLEDRPVYNNTLCFEPFPFPVAIKSQQMRIRALAEELDAHRKRQQVAHSDLTITGMYNVLEKLRSGEALSAKDKVIHEQGLVSVLKKLHDDLDAAVFDAYGWPHDLSDEQILERLVALNAERAAEEKRGLVRWLRPEFQNPTGAKAATQEKLAATDELRKPLPRCPPLPRPGPRNSPNRSPPSATWWPAPTKPGASKKSAPPSRAPRRPTWKKSWKAWKPWACSPAIPTNPPASGSLREPGSRRGADAFGETNATKVQAVRISFKTSSASTSLPAATSASDASRERCNASRSSSSSQSPGSRGSKSTSVGRLLRGLGHVVLHLGKALHRLAFAQEGNLASAAANVEGLVWLGVEIDLEALVLPSVVGIPESNLTRLALQQVGPARRRVVRHVTDLEAVRSGHAGLTLQKLSGEVDSVCLGTVGCRGDACQPETYEPIARGLDLVKTRGQMDGHIGVLLQVSHNDPSRF